MKTVEQYYKEKFNRTAFSDGTPKRTDVNGDPIEFRLSLEEMESLFKEAGITPDDIGTGSGRYCLMRNDDIGHYEYGNCKFGLHSENSSDTWLGKSRVFSDEHKAKLSESHKGIKYGPMSQEQKDKLREIKKGIPQERTECPHCGKVGGLSLMKRYHFDKCKFKNI